MWFPFWIGIGLVFMVERRRDGVARGWRARCSRPALFPELFFAMFLNVVYVKGIVDISLAAGHLEARRPTGRPRDGRRLMFTPSLSPAGASCCLTVLHSGRFAVLAAFVALNTVMYVALAFAKMLPKVYPTDWFTTRNRPARRDPQHLPRRRGV